MYFTTSLALAAGDNHRISEPSAFHASDASDASLVSAKVIAALDFTKSSLCLSFLSRFASLWMPYCYLTQPRISRCLVLIFIFVD
jgi:hypothetical protein